MHVAVDSSAIAFRMSVSARVLALSLLLELLLIGVGWG